MVTGCRCRPAIPSSRTCTKRPQPHNPMLMQHLSASLATIPKQLNIGVQSQTDVQTSPSMTITPPKSQPSTPSDVQPGTSAIAKTFEVNHRMRVIYEYIVMRAVHPHPRRCATGFSTTTHSWRVIIDKTDAMRCFIGCSRASVRDDAAVPASALLRQEWLAASPDPSEPPAWASVRR